MRILFLVWVQKMASAKSLEDMLLSSDIDESAVNALVGSLESQLSSSGIQIPRSDIASSSVNSNHIASGTVVDSNSRLTDGQKHGALLGSLLEQGNSLSSKNLSSTHILGLNSVSSPALANAVMVTLAGALPASGYINQVSTTQQALLSSAVIGRHVSNSDIKLVYSPQSTASHFSTAVNSTAANTGVITTTNLPRNNLKVTTLPNGNPNLNVNSTGQSVPIVAVTSGAPVITGPSGAIQQSSGTTLSAIHNLANIASQQPHIIIPSSIQQQHPNLSSQHIATLNSKNIMSPRVLNREQLDQGLGLKPQIIVKDGHAPIPCQDNIIQSSALDHRHSPSPVRHNNNFQVSSSPSPVITTKPNHLSHTSGQPINVMTQVMTNQNIIPGVQIVNVNPSRIGPQGIPGQKTLAPRVVISNPVRIAPQMIATRPGTPVQVPGQNSITIPPGIVRGALLVKTENGQLQVVNVTPGLPPSSTTTQVPGTTTYRLQSVQPGTASVMRTLAPQHMTVTLPVSSSGIKPMHQSGTPGGMRPLTSQQMTVTLPTSSSAAVKTSLQNSSGTPNTVMSTILQQSSPVMALTSPVIAPRNSSPLQAPSQNATVKMSPNTVKKKCKNFLSTLIRLASDQPDQVATNVKNLIQGLIDGNVQPEDFTTQLQKELNSSPQPCLIPFLKKSLPYLRHSLMTKEMTIEGVRAPLPGAATLPSHTTVPLTQVGQLRPTFTQSSTTLRMVSSVAGSALTAQLSQPPGAAILAHQRLITPRVPPTVVPQSKTNLVIATTTPTPSVKSTVSITNAKIAVVSTTPGGALHSKFIPSKSTSPSGKEREKRNFTAVSRDEDDINDVAAMGGVNLVEESQRILASNSELIGTQIRSCKDENFVFSGPLQKRVSKIATSYGLEEVTDDVVALVSHAAQMRLKALVEKLGIVAEHRMENIKTESRYEVSQDPKSQIKFLEELDKLEKKRHEEQEREILLRAAKSRSKLEDPEQLKLKQKAKEMQRAEIEEMRQREANMTALLAIGPRKKLKAESSGCGLNQLGLSALSSGSNSVTKPQMRPRVKRVNLRDLLFLMEQERDTVRKPLLYKSYVK